MAGGNFAAKVRGRISAQNSLPPKCADEFPHKIPCRQSARTNLLRQIPCRRSARTNLLREIPCRKSARTNLLHKIPCRRSARTNFRAKFVDTNPASFAKQNSVSRAQALRHKYAKTTVYGFTLPEECPKTTVDGFLSPENTQKPCVNYSRQLCANVV